MGPDNLRGVGGIGGDDLFRGLEALPAEDHVVLAAEFGGDLLKGFVHGAGDGGVGEVAKGLVFEGREGHRHGFLILRLVVETVGEVEAGIAGDADADDLLEGGVAEVFGRLAGEARGYEEVDAGVEAALEERADDGGAQLTDAGAGALGVGVGEAAGAQGFAPDVLEFGAGFEMEGELSGGGEEVDEGARGLGGRLAGVEDAGIGLGDGEEQGSLREGVAGDEGEEAQAAGALIFLEARVGVDFGEFFAGGDVSEG